MDEWTYPLGLCFMLWASSTTCEYYVVVVQLDLVATACTFMRQMTWHFLRCTLGMLSVSCLLCSSTFIEGSPLWYNMCFSCPFVQAVHQLPAKDELDMEETDSEDDNTLLPMS